jgi:hypothetical protein
MTKTKRDKSEGKTAFAARVVTQYGDYISARDAWERLVDKRGVGVKGWTHFQSNLSDAVRFGLLSKKRGEDSKGKMRMLYGPPQPTGEELTLAWEEEAQRDFIKHAPVKEVVEVVQRPNRVSIEDIPLGDILSYNHVERGDIMSVLTDLIYDSPLRELRERYPTLEDLVWDVAVVRGEE